MIEWLSVGFNALWIFGLGLEVAALSFADYLAGQQKRPFWRVVQMPACRIVIDLGLLLFCLGLVGCASALWERVFWVVIALGLILLIWQTRKAKKT
jgi:hypothetical protein